jgi:hypothetical protein
MPARRTAIVLLFSCVCLVPAARGTPSSGAAPSTADTQSALRVAPQARSRRLPVTPRRAGLPSFSRWRWRLKSVLENTDPKLIDEADVGPALPPNQPGITCPMNGRISRLIVLTPLRC